MMSHHSATNLSLLALPDFTRRSLEALRSRRHWLSLCRGLSISLVLFVLLLLLGVTLDALWLGAAARWLGCLTLYGLVAGSLVWLCLVPKLQPLDLRSEARRFEQLDPRLRELLLSAVELSESQPGVVDSTAFRVQLQTQVLQLLRSVDVQQLLPWSLVQRYVSVAASSLAALLLLSLLPGLYLPQRMARVLFPLGDWGRVSRIAIALERPTPHSKTVPRDDIVAITARVSGPQPETLVLETRTLGRGEGFQLANPVAIASSNMLPVKSAVPPPRMPFYSDISRFEALLSANSELIEYRVQGAGASTPWYRLNTLPRPQATEFEKHITPPPGTSQHAAETAVDNLPATVSVADHGHLQVLVGSQIEMRLSVDQATSIAELRWETASSAPGGSSLSVDSAAPPALPLRRDSRLDQLVVDFTVMHSADYRIHLQSRDSGLTNMFSPTYHIQAIEDQAPTVTWLVPADSRTIASPVDVLLLQNEIVDEFPLAALTRSVRVNGSQWDSEPISAAPTTGKTLEMRTASPVKWELDLSAMRLKPGDYLEVKLTAIDRHGQTSESPIVQFSMSSTSLAQAAGPGELLRRDVAAGLDRIAHKLSEVKSIHDQVLEARAESEPTIDVDQYINTAERLMDELAQELAGTGKKVEQATAQSEDASHSQTLIHVGEALVSLAASISGQLRHLEHSRDASNREHLLRILSDARSKLNFDNQRAAELSQHFATLISYDVVLRHVRQLSLLADAERQLAAADQAATVQPEQLLRRQNILTEQMKEAQQALLESLPLVREETRPALQRSAVQLGQQIASAESFAAITHRASTVELAGALAEQLSLMRTLSRLDKGLPAAAKIALRRLSELAPPTAQSLEEVAQLLAQQLPLDTQLAASSSQLIRQRELERAAPQGDRLYAADLGSVQRALETLDLPADRHSPAINQPVRDIAAAIDTLQSIHQVYQADTLLAELLNNERQSSEASGFAWRGPREWDALQQRLEQAVNNLREAKLPNELVHELDELRSSPVARQAARKFTDRLGQPGLPHTTAAELEDLRGALRPILGKLAEHAQQARRTLTIHAPKISELAQYAAEEVEQVEQQSTQLAEAIARDEIPDMPGRLEQLAKQTDALQRPVDRLRQALIDRADSQDLLNRQQTQLAQQADAAIEVVDAVDSQLEQASVGTTRAPSPSAQSAQLHTAAANQAQSADALAHLADHFRDLEDQEQSPSSQHMAERIAELQQQAAALGDRHTSEPDASTSPAPDPYALAEQLAEMAAQDPQAVLEQLERELSTNRPMSQEMSSIARQAAQQSLEELEQAEQRQQSLTNQIELSDANFKAQKELLLHDLQIAAEGTRQLLNTLTSEAKWTAGASKNEGAAERVTQLEQPLKGSLEQVRELGINQPFEQLLRAASALQDQLNLANSELLIAGSELTKASFEEFHQSGADLANRRREMRDRQRRIQQESVRDAQTIERNEQQRLKRLEHELSQLAVQVQRSEQELHDAQRRLVQQPEQVSLTQEVAEHARQLELARSTQTANEKLQAALAVRAESATKALEKLNAQERRPLDSVNPTAELSAQLAKQAAELSGGLAIKLQTWQTSPLAQAQAAATQLSHAYESEQQIGQAVVGAADGLARAARHEQRLQHTDVSAQLEQAAQATGQVVENELQQAERQLALAREQALSSTTPTAQATAQATTAAQQASQLAESAIHRSTDSLRKLLTEEHTASSAAATSAAATSAAATPAASPSVAGGIAPSLDAVQKARLLDELDQQLHKEQNFGQKEDDSQPAPSPSSSSEAPPTTLSDAAGQIAKSLSQARQPATPSSAPSDLGMATQSLQATVEPQGPVAVRVTEVERRGGAWGALREQSAEGLVETGRESIAPRFRQQVEAYFRELAEQGAGSRR